MEKTLFNPCVRDRSKDLCVIQMKSGKLRFVLEDRDIAGRLPNTTEAPNGFIILQNQGWHGIYDVIKTEEYIQLTRYHVGYRTYTYSEFQKTIKEGRSILQHCSIGNAYTSPEEIKNKDQYYNVRFYKNGSVAVIISIKTSDEEIHSFQINLTFNIDDWYRVERAVMDKLNMPLKETKEKMESTWGTWLRAREDLYQAWKNDKILTEIKYEQDIVPQFLQMKNLIPAYNSIFPSREKSTFIIESKQYKGRWKEVDTLPSNWDTFFINCKGMLKDQIMKTSFDKLRDARKAVTAAFLVSNATVSEKYLKTQTQKLEKVSDIWEKYYDKDLSAQHEKTSVRRIDNLIVISSSPVAWRSPHLCLFDTAKKVRQIYQKENNIVTRCPLFNSTIRDLADALATYDISYKGKPDKIFEGTLLHWIVSNAKNNTLPENDQAFNACLHRDADWDTTSRSYTYKNFCIKDWLETNIYIDAKSRKYTFLILFTETLLMEQLCKCGLWNIYTRSVTSNDVFAPINTNLKWSDAELLYNSKNKSLTHSLGLSMKQLQYINKIYEPQDSTHPNKCVTLPAVLYSLDTTLKEIKALDFVTFTKLISLGVQTSNNSSACVRLRRSYAEIQTLMASMSLSQKINFCVKYGLDKTKDSRYCWPENSSDMLMYYSDYLNFRRNAVDLLQRLSIHSETAQVELENFNQQWPIFPEACTVFHRYFSGTLLKADGYHDERAYSEALFKQFFLKRYPKEACEWVEDQNHTLSGVVLHLSAAEHVILLHDEISIWLREKNDASINEAFSHASEDAKRYEYVSKDYGLQIVAPTKPDDLRQEGQVLSHCVGGYVQAMATGKNTILFIRRNDYPNHPYFTVDLAGGEIRQIHCYRNGNPTASDIEAAYKQSKYEVYNSPKDIVGFLLDWAKHVKGVDAKSIHKNYGCLCALR